MKQKPCIVRNKHKHAPYKWRCYWGRYNGYADTIEKAYKACLKCASRSKHLVADQKRYPQFAKLLEVAEGTRPQFANFTANAVNSIRRIK